MNNGPLRMFIALQVLRAWNNGSVGFDALVIATIHNWIDGGMQGPIPWPRSPFFEEWAAKRGYSCVDGFIGFRCTARMLP